jgi:hypothetical protein
MVATDFPALKSFTRQQVYNLIYNPLFSNGLSHLTIKQEEILDTGILGCQLTDRKKKKKKVIIKPKGKSPY